MSANYLFLASKSPIKLSDIQLFGLIPQQEFLIIPLTEKTLVKKKKKKRLSKSKRLSLWIFPVEPALCFIRPDKSSDTVLS